MLKCSFALLSRKTLSLPKQCTFSQTTMRKHLLSNNPKCMAAAIKVVSITQSVLFLVIDKLHLTKFVRLEKTTYALIESFLQYVSFGKNRLPKNMCSCQFDLVYILVKLPFPRSNSKNCISARNTSGCASSARDTDIQHELWIYSFT